MINIIIIIIITVTDTIVTRGKVRKRVKLRNVKYLLANYLWNIINVDKILYKNISIIIIHANELWEIDYVTVKTSAVTEMNRNKNANDLCINEHIYSSGPSPPFPN